MDFSSLLTWAIIWLGLDALTDCLCIALCLACFAVVKRMTRRTN